MFRRIIFNSLIVLAMLLVSVSNPNLSLVTAAAPAAQQAAPRYAPATYNCSSGQTDIPPASCEALVALYNSTNGSGWTNHSGWLATNAPCSWYGVYCNSGDVMFLWLASNQLSGSIPSQLQNLTNLLELDLSSNQLSGSIPPQLGSMANLGQLWLFSNQLSGSIPPELGNLPNGGGCLCLSNNQLSGSIPPQLGNLVNLKGLHLDHNHLSGLVPSGLAQLVSIGDPGQGGDSSFELRLDNNWLTIPNPYPSTPVTALETFLINKDPGWETTQGVMADILPAASGEVKSADGHVDVTIPSGGVTQPVTLKLTSLTKPGASTGNLGFANTSFSLTAYDTFGLPLTFINFAKPVTITLSYQDSDVAGLDESQLILYDWDTATSAWKDAAQTCSPASTYLRDPAHNTLSVDVCHLTEFALLAKKNSTIYLPLIARP